MTAKKQRKIAKLTYDPKTYQRQVLGRRFISMYSALVSTVLLKFKIKITQDSG